MKRVFNYETTVKRFAENAKGRAVIVCGDDFLTEEIIETVKHCEIDLGGVLTRTPLLFAKEKTLNEDSIKKNTNHYYYLMAGFSGQKEYYEMFIRNGLCIDLDFGIMGMGGYVERLNLIDNLLTLNRVSDNKVGKKVYGNENATHRIVILGNSTSDDSTGAVECWSKKMYGLSQIDNRDLAIYNCAMQGYSSTQEFLKLSRDILSLKPDCVISLSGFNDIEDNAYEIGFPFLHKYQNKYNKFLLKQPKLAPDSMLVRNVNSIYYGEKVSENSVDIWISNMRKMHALCKEFEILFIGCLQPMYEYRKSISTPEHKKIIDHYNSITNNFLVSHEPEFCSKARKKMEEYDYLVDLTGVFENKENTYFDICHYTDRGNEIIAEAIYKYLLGKGIV